jgi:hypothetical protein
MSRVPRRPARVTPPVRGRRAAERRCVNPVMPLTERLTCAPAPKRPRRAMVPPRSAHAPVREPIEPMTETPVDVPPTDPPAGLFALILFILALLLLLGLL